MKRTFVFCCCWFLSHAFAAIFSPTEIATLKHHLLENLTSQGAVIASPSRVYPNYYFHWVRDAAITMDLIAAWYEKDHAIENKQRLIDYVGWVEQVEHQPEISASESILGEPKFYLDGRPYDGAWSRPQNDGPALRALALIHFAHTLLKRHEQEYVTTHLYHPSLNSNEMGVINIDLEYIARHWQDKNYDLWGEVYGHHFFTGMVQRRALLEGAILARYLQDYEAAQFYLFQARAIQTQLNEYVDIQNNLIQATLPPHSGPQKHYELDSSVILAVLLGNNHDRIFTLDNCYVQGTIQALRQVFQETYPLNDGLQGAILHGRYPGDSYDGYRTDGTGNPWFILTATMAEYYYRIGLMSGKNKPNDIDYLALGDDYLRLIKRYAPDLKLSEQINLHTGEQQGAISLSWSYVAVLRAILVREELINKITEVI